MYAFVLVVRTKFLPQELDAALLVGHLWKGKNQVYVNATALKDWCTTNPEWPWKKTIYIYIIIFIKYTHLPKLPKLRSKLETHSDDTPLHTESRSLAGDIFLTQASLIELTTQKENEDTNHSLQAWLATMASLPSHRKMQNRSALKIHQAFPPTSN